MTDKAEIDRMRTPVLPAITVFLLSIVSCSHEIATKPEVEEISFRSGRFNLVGELRRPALKAGTAFLPWNDVFEKGVPPLFR